MKNIYFDEDVKKLENENKILTEMYEAISQGKPIEKILLSKYIKKFSNIPSKNLKKFNKLLQNCSRKLFEYAETRFLANLLLKYSEYYSESFLEMFGSLKKYLLELTKIKLLYQNYIKKIKIKLVLTSIILYITSIFSVLFLYPIFQEIFEYRDKFKMKTIDFFLMSSIGITLIFSLNTYIFFEFLEIDKRDLLLFLLILNSIFILSLLKAFNLI